MAKPKFTPAPWEVFENTSTCKVMEVHYYHAAVIGKGGEKMANGKEYIANSPPTRSKEKYLENLANIRLMAAAPDLLAALIAVEDDVLDNNGYNELNENIVMLRAAINKATEGQ